MNLKQLQRCSFFVMIFVLSLFSNKLNAQCAGTLPYHEGFNLTTANTYNACMYDVNNSGGSYLGSKAKTYVTAPGGFYGQTNHGTYTGAGIFSWYWTPYTGVTDTLYTPQFTLIGGATYTFDFWYQGDGYSGWTVTALVKSATSGVTTLGNVITSGTTSIQTYQHYTQTFIPPTTGVYDFGVAESNNITPYYFTLDDISVTGGPACVAPTAQPTTLVVTPSANGGQINFTPASPAPDGYIVVASTGALTGNPTAATSYNVGGTIGNGTVVAVGTAPPFNITTLAASTTYTITVFPYSASGCSGGPIYNTTSPLTGTLTTCAASTTPTVTAATGVSGSAFTANWNAVPGATSYQINVSTSASMSPSITGYPVTGLSSATTSYAVTGLNIGTTYYYTITAIASGCLGTSSVQNITMPCLGTLPYTEGFSLAANNTYNTCMNDLSNSGASLLGSKALTYVTAPGGFYGQTNHGTYTGAGIFSWYYYPYTGITDTLFTPLFNLTAGASYSFSFWYQGDGYSGWNVNALAKGSSVGVTTFGNVISSGTTSSTTYAQYTYTFTPTTTDFYKFGISVTNNVTPYYFSIDDINIVSLNCVGAPTAGTITPAGPLNICAGSPVTLTLGGYSTGTGISIQWQQSTNGGTTYTAIPGATNPTYTFTPTQNVMINAVVTCSFSTQSATAPAVTVNYVPLPTITPGAFPTVLVGTTIASLPYTATGSPANYSILWSAAALSAGFVNVSNGVLPASPISIAVPAAAAPATYTGMLSVTTASGCASTNIPISVTVSSNPTMVLGASPTICAGVTTAQQPYTASTLNPTTFNVVWSPAALSAGFVNMNNATITNSPLTITGIPANATGGSYTGTLTVSNGSGTSPNYTITINIASLPTITLGPNPTVCNGNTSTDLTYTTTTSSPTLYNITWNAAAQTAGFTNVVNATFPSSSPITVTVPGTVANGTYTGTITVKNGTCTGLPVSFSVTVLPLPTLTSPLTAPDQCNNNIFHYTPTGGSGATVFSWYRAAVPGISNPAASGTGDPAETLVNTTTSPITVTYAYTFTGSNNCSNTQNVTVTIKPYAVLSSSLTPVTCSYYVFNYVPTSATPGTTFTWTRAVVPGVINYAGFGTGSPNEALDNVIDQPVDVTYAYTLSANGCVSNVQNVVVTVQPNPTITSTLNPPSICSNNTFNYAPTSNLSNSTYSWTRAAVPGISNAASNGAGNISETLTNTTDSVINVTYVYSVTANACTSPNTYNVIVPVNPGPVLTSPLTSSACTNTLFTYTPSSSIPGTTYTWSRASVSGISNSAANGTGAISETLVNTTSSPITVTYVYNMTANGCSGTANVNVVVNPVQTPSFTISSPTGNTVCAGDAINFTSTSNISNGIYVWQNNGVAVTGANSSTYSYTPTTGGDNITCVITAAASACYMPSTITSNSITVAVAPVTVPTISISGPTSAVVGTTVTMTATVTGTGGSYIINWYNNGAFMTSTTGLTMTYTKGTGTDHISASVLPQSTGCYDTAVTAPPAHTIAAIPLNVNTVSTSDNVQVYPNPMNNVLYIDNIKETSNYRVLNLIGSVVESGTLQTGNNHISTKDLASGVYMLELSNKNGEKTVTRVVKE